MGKVGKIDFKIFVEYHHKKYKNENKPLRTVPYTFNSRKKILYATPMASTVNILVFFAKKEEKVSGLFYSQEMCSVRLVQGL